jgi:FG-GAP-like repeat
MMHYSPSGSGANVVNRGDFNHDGIPDIVTGNNGGTGGNGVSVSLGIGDGRFQAPKNSATGVGTFDMAVGDFNGDGKLDVALAGYVSSTESVVQIMLGNGNGTFTKGQTINLPANVSPRSITTGDFNNDGKLDLAVAENQVVLYKGAGNGTFTKAASFTVGTQTPILQVRVGDFNADGKTDIAVSDGAGLYVMWNTGPFTFSTAHVASGAFGIFATPVDVNQDNFTDLLVTYYTCEIGKDITPGACTNWKVLLGSANKIFRQTANMHLSIDYQGFWGTTAADVNGDGINDIVGISNAAQPFELLIWLGNPDGSYHSTPLSYTIGSNSSAADLVASDFNRDGKIDFAIPTPGFTNTTGLAVFLNATPRAACTPNTVSPSVTVCEPQDLIYSTSPVHWIADSRDTSHAVTATQIYVDNKLVTNSPSASLNEELSLAKGPHFVVTKALAGSTASFQSDRRITIYSGVPGETCPASPASMNFCLPTQNETTSTSLHVFANSDSSTAQITSVQVYIDNNLIYNDTSGATYVDTAFTVSAGTHLVVVKAFDANGKSYSQSRNITAK